MVIDSINVNHTALETPDSRAGRPTREPSPARTEKVASQGKETRGRMSPPEPRTQEPADPRAPEMELPTRSVPSVTFQRDKDSGEMYISVVDKESGKELRQVPPEELRQLASALEKWTGNVVDTVA